MGFDDFRNNFEIPKTSSPKIEQNEEHEENKNEAIKIEIGNRI